ncbi:MAG: hypothetical protein QOE86_835 [Solirubrobacteraceae bacterium]|jgi:hypothetical protein|nr:hypothetical protein [Solirubrobacteraceae bacterium]
MPTPDEIEQTAGIQPADELQRKRIWAAAQAYAILDGGRAPAASDLSTAESMLRAAALAGDEHLQEGRGRATITLTDSGKDDEVDVAVEFVPQLEEVGEDEVAGTPAQLLALEILNGAFNDGDQRANGAPQ